MNFVIQIKNLFQNGPGQKSKDLDWNEDHVWASNLFLLLQTSEIDLE